MHILMISIGKDILCEGSSTQKRHFEYGKICESLDIIVLGNYTKLHQTEHDPPFPSTGGHIKGGNNENVKIYAAGGNNKISRFFRACALAGEIAKNNKIDLVTTQDAVYTGLIGYCLKKKFKIRLNAQIHGLEEKFLNKILFLSLKKKIIKNADSVRVVSERLKEWVVDKYGIANDRIFVIPIYTEYESGIKNHESGIKNQGLRNNLLAQAGEMKKLEIRNWKLEKNFTILTVGRLVKVKNIKLQIEAMADVIKIFPDVRLVIVGDGPEKEKLHRLANRLKLKDKVEFKGWQEKVKPYYENADLFLLTSNSEGWGLVVVEAMKFGLPVIMTDVGCAGEVIKNEKNGIVIPIKDKKALIAAISEMIANKEKREVFAEKGLETVNKLPDKEETLGLYRRMWE